ncbi:hypothetical protein LCGC14_3033210, partial [marine sediment metagenome]
SGLLLYTILCLNLLVSSALIIRKRLAVHNSSPEAISKMDALLEISGEIRGHGLDDIEKLMLKNGYSPVRQMGNKALYACKGRLSFIPGVLLRAGLMVVLVSLPVSQTLREQAYVTMTEGDTISVLGSVVTLNGLDVPLPEEFIQTGQAGDESLLRLAGLKAALSVGGNEITLHDGVPSTKGGIALRDFIQTGDESLLRLAGLKAALSVDNYDVTLHDGLPSTKSGIALRVSHLGYTLPISTKEGKALAYLDALPPGRESKPAFGMTALIEPERLVKKGLLSGSLYNLKDPRFRIITEHGEYLLKSGETSEDKRLGLGALGLYVQVEARMDPALSFLKAGLVMFALGLVLMPLRVFWYE